MTKETARNAAFRRRRMDQLLHPVGAQLPGRRLGKTRSNEVARCWRELGRANQPIFDGCLSVFLLVDEDGCTAYLSIPRRTKYDHATGGV